MTEEKKVYKMVFSTAPGKPWEGTKLDSNRRKKNTKKGKK